MNIKNIKNKKRVPVDELVVGNHYYITKNTNYLRIEVISIKDQKTVEFKVVGKNTPIEGAICKLDMNNSECVLFHIFMPANFDNKNDTRKAIGESTTRENVELLCELFHIAIDGRATTDGIEECKDLLEILESRKIITKNDIYKRFLREGVEETDEDIEQFLLNRLLPPHGRNFQIYTHKGWDRDYSLEEEKDYQYAIEIKQSWEIKKYLLARVVEKVYSLSELKAETLSVLLYNVHLLRDIQYNRYNEETSLRENYLIGACIEMEKYIFPFIKDKDVASEDKILMDLLDSCLKGIQKILLNHNLQKNIYCQRLDEQINKMIGSFDNSKNGCITEVISVLSR